MDTFVLGITLFTMIVLTLVSIIIFARSKLVSSGDVNIIINGEKKVSVPAGGKLLQTLAAESSLFLQHVGEAELVLSAELRSLGWWSYIAYRRKSYK